LVLALGLTLCGCPPELKTHQPPAPKVADTDGAAAARPQAAALPRTVDGSAPEVVLLMTNPSRSRVKDLLALTRDRIFHVPGLRVVGIYPAAAAARFASTEALLEEEKIGWIELRPVGCEIPDDQIFAQNPCVETFRALADESAGLLLNGGPDIPPRFYGEETLLTTVIDDPPRHRLELSLLHHLLAQPGEQAAGLVARRPEYFVFGICLGMQTLNVALGGTMHQDIPSELYRVRSADGVLEQPPEQRHRNAHTLISPQRRPDYWVLHPIKPKPGWPFSAPSGEAEASYRVVSAHHQALEKLGRDLRPLATSLDGKVVEAVAHTVYPNVMGVQFHPEYRMIYEVDPGASADAPVNIEGKPNDPAMRVFHVRLWRVLAQRLQIAAKAAREAR
jgi:putative glutamine amidotransferase